MGWEGFIFLSRGWEKVILVFGGKMVLSRELNVERFCLGRCLGERSGGGELLKS